MLNTRDQKGPGNRRNLQGAALLALSMLGLGTEDEFLFRLYTAENGDRISKLTIRLLDEALAEPLAKRLIECAENSRNSMRLRTRCLEGFKYLHNSFEGDDGSAQRVSRIARGAPEEVRKAACDALEVFSGRGGKWAALNADDDSFVGRCSLRGAASEDADVGSKSRELEQTIRDLLDKARRRSSGER